MAKESLIFDTTVLRVAIDWRGSDPGLTRSTSLQAITAVLLAFPSLPAGSVFVIYGRAHSLLLPHPADPDQGSAP